MPNFIEFDNLDILYNVIMDSKSRYKGRFFNMICNEGDKKYYDACYNIGKL